jgi:post-segregation antitoxin (ccd killing protein)
MAETIPSEMREKAREIAVNWVPWTSEAQNSAIEAIASALWQADREATERAAKIADEHRSRIPDHDPEAQRADLVAQGYGNAAFNIACAIRRSNTQ